ncbi:MAG TPA: NAD(P)/FAD-dependent oxidoreductase [Actinomycetota bacterium]|nr:NAD(P)/FAD-dependent oxidoreductase [Actinomycetota bacterium]
MSEDTVDVVVAGAGHNGLIVAAYLAKAGLRVLVVEARPTVGGDTSTEELVLPGFRHDTCSTAHNLLQSNPLLRDDELRLSEYGLEYLRPDPVVHMPFADGASITQWLDVDRTCEEFARCSPRDADALRRLLDDYDGVKGAFAASRATPVGWGPSLRERLAAGPNGSRWVRRLAESAWDVIRDGFEDEHTRAFLLGMAFMTVQPTDRPGTGPLVSSLLYGRQQQSWTLPRGGSGALPTALVRLIEAHDGRIVTGEPVSALVLEGGRCVGVETETGSRYRARRAVVSSIHVRHLLDMAPRRAWDEGFAEAVERWQGGPAMFVTHLATTEAPTFRSEGGPLAPVAAMVVTSVDRMLRIGGDMARGVVATEDPVVLSVCATVEDPSRAPAGRHTVNVVGFQPYDLPDGPERWDAIEDEVSDAHLAQLRRFAPNLSDETILGSLVRSPLGLERFNAHNFRGSCHGGDQGPSQSGELRPAAGWASHRLPIEGLYQTGSTTHPGASVSGGPGRNATLVVMRDLGIDFEATIRG